MREMKRGGVTEGEREKLMEDDSLSDGPRDK